MSAAHRATQVERSRARESRGRSRPTGERGDERARHVAPVGLGPAHDEALARPGRGAPRARAASSPRTGTTRGRRPWTSTTTPPERQSTSCAGDEAQVGPDQPGPGPEGDQARGPLAPGHRGLGVGQGQVGGQLGLGVGRLGPLAPEGSGSGADVEDPLGQEQQVRAQGAPPGPDQCAVPTTMKRSMTALESTTAGSGSRPQSRAKAHRRLAAHNSERALGHEPGSAETTTVRAKAPAAGARPRRPGLDALGHRRGEHTYIYRMLRTLWGIPGEKVRAMTGAPPLERRPRPSPRPSPRSASCCPARCRSATSPAPTPGATATATPAAARALLVLDPQGQRQDGVQDAEPRPGGRLPGVVREPQAPPGSHPPARRAQPLGRSRTTPAPPAASDGRGPGPPECCGRVTVIPRVTAETRSEVPGQRQT